MTLGLFVCVCFLSQERTFYSHQIFEDCSKLAKKASWEVAQICEFRLSTWQYNLGQVTYTPSSAVSSSMKWQ